MDAFIDPDPAVDHDPDDEREPQCEVCWAKEVWLIDGWICSECYARRYGPYAWEEETS